MVAWFYYSTLPYTGFELVGGSQIGAVMPASPARAAGLRVGDRIVALDGEPFRPGEPYLRTGQAAMELVIERAGELLRVTLELRPPLARESFYVGSHFLVALACWVIAMAVLLAKPSEVVPQFFALVVLLGAAALVVWSLAYLGLVWANLAMYTLVTAAGPSFLHFHTLFPERQAVSGRKAMLGTAYGSALILWLLAIVSDLAFYKGIELAGQDSPSLAPLLQAHFALCVLGGLVLLVRVQRRTASGVCRRQAALVLLGTALALLPFVVLIVVPLILSAPYPLPSWVVLLLLLFIPLSYAYAILRHRLMNLDAAINRSVVYYLLSLILLGLYVLLSLSLRSVAPQLFAGPTAPGGLALIVGLVLLLGPLRQAIQRVVDRAFYGGWYDYESLISHVSEALRDALDVNTVARVLVLDVPNRMRVEAAALFLPQDESALCMIEGRGFELPSCISPRGMLAGLVRQIGHPVASEDLAAGLLRRDPTRDELESWFGAGVRVWVPLVAQDELMGILVLGGKAAGDFFYPRDFRMLTTLAQQAALALGRVQLIEHLRGQYEEARSLAQQVMALQERNQQQMAAEIHDRLLQDLAVVDLFLGDAEAAFRPEEVRSAREALDEVAGYLRTVLFELQPPAWEHSDLRTLVEDYVDNFRRRRGIAVDLETTGDGHIEVPEQVRVAVYRVLQEALNNARSHAKASQLRVRLDVHSERVCLEVTDDGLGFDVPTYLGQQVDRGHLGLLGMRERAAEVGARLEIGSAPGKGTRVLFEVPLSANSSRGDDAG